MTEAQKQFYNHLISSVHLNKFFDEGRGRPRNPYPELAHLTTPAERYKHLVESPNYWGKGKYAVLEVG